MYVEFENEGSKMKNIDGMTLSLAVFEISRRRKNIPGFRLDLAQFLFHMKRNQNVSKSFTPKKEAKPSFLGALKSELF